MARILVNLLALALLAAYFMPVIVKLKDVPLAIVALGGMALAVADAWQSLRDRRG